MGKKKAAIVYINNETGIVAADVYKRDFIAAGGQVVAIETMIKKRPISPAPAQGARRQSGHHPPAGAGVRYPAGDCPDAPAWPQPADQLLFGRLQSETAPATRCRRRRRDRDLARTRVDDSEAVKAYVARWTKEVGREPNGLPYTQYLYDAPYLVAAVLNRSTTRKCRSRVRISATRCWRRKASSFR